jgi:predicted RNase H-like HicB family nuclease
MCWRPTEKGIMKVSVQAEFKLFGVIKRQGDWYIAHCPPLDVTTQGRTFDEAKKNLSEASQLFIVSCLERGTLDQALKELGFEPHPHFNPHGRDHPRRIPCVT